MSFTLHDYQEDLLEQARAYLRAQVTSLLIQSPTGSGKTVLTAHMLGTASGRRHRCWFVCHRRELIKQSMRTFDQSEIPYGVVAANFAADRKPLVQICGIQTLFRRYNRLPPPRMIVWDECHHLAAKTWATIHKAFPESVHIGLSATPERLDGEGLGKWFDVLLTGPPVADLIERGYLCPYRLYAPSQVDLSNVHTRMGDFVKGELTTAMDRPKITGDAISHYQRLAAGKRAVAFCVTVEHSRHVVASFQAAGIPAVHVDGETHPAERDAAIAAFEAGRVKILSNVELFGEGFDLPAMEAAILLRPTQSIGLYLQQVGRALRTAPGKTEALILDHASNSERHGLPDDERTWSLAGRPKRRGRSEPHTPVKQCPTCFAVVTAAATLCKYCGARFVVTDPIPEAADGELVEVNKAAMRKARAREQGQARSYEDLVELGRLRGYRNPRGWAHYVYSSRQRRSGA